MLSGSCNTCLPAFPSSCTSSVLLYLKCSQHTSTSRSLCLVSLCSSLFLKRTKLSSLFTSQYHFVRNTLTSLSTSVSPIPFSSCLLHNHSLLFNIFVWQFSLEGSNTVFVCLFLFFLTVKTTGSFHLQQSHTVLYQSFKCKTPQNPRPTPELKKKKNFTFSKYK